MPGQIRVIIVDRHKRRQADIVEPPARANTFFIIDDAEGLLMLFQVVQEGLGRQRLFQIVLTPAFIYWSWRGFNSRTTAVASMMASMVELRLSLLLI